MARDPHKRATSAALRLSRGFSLVELVLATAVMLVLSALAMPRIMRTMHLYQLNSAASQVADIVKFTRFEAIRRNIGVNCRTQPSGNTYVVWADSNGDGVPDAPERQFVLSGSASFMPASSVPTSGSLAASLGVTSITTLSASGATRSILFDQRGAVNYGANPVTVYVFFIGLTQESSPEFRAVVVLPSGATQIWDGDPSSGNWRQIL